MLDAMKSQPVAGSQDASIYPYIRKIDIMSSNTYVISGQDQIAIIDPGGLEEQIGHIEMVIEGLQEELLRPVTVYLTHVHLDHWAELKQRSQHRNLNNAALAVQASGAEAIENRDGAVTLATLLGRRMIQTPVHLRLLDPCQLTKGGQFRTHLDGWTCRYALRSLKIAPDLVLHSQMIPLGEGDHLEIFHTPGHSPDSICIRAGSLLMVGDLFFAPNPGLAGVCGWSCQDFIKSIQKVQWILENKKIDICCSGHGRPIDAQTARRTLEAMRRDASNLQSVERVTPMWARLTAAYASDLVSEMERIYTIIAWRLEYIAHVLEELEEEAEAKKTEALLDPRQLDALFNDFRSCFKDLQEGKKPDIELVHKAGQTMGRLDKLLEARKLVSIIDPSVLERARRLINDYSMTYRGFRPPYFVSYEEVNRVVSEALDHLINNPYHDDAMISADSGEEYISALKSRIAHIDLLKNVDLAFLPDPRKPFARMDKERFRDAVLDIFERFIGAGSIKMVVTTSQDEDWVRIGIKGPASFNPISRSERFLERCLALSGGFLQSCQVEDEYQVEIELSALSLDI